MQDTISKNTGNSRTLASVPNFLTLYPTYEDFARALINRELPIDLGPINPAGVSQKGTDLNKANILKDATAALFGLGPDAVLDDVLNAIAGLENSGWELLESWTAAGTYTWTAPDLFGGKPYKIGLLVVGAGGSGSAISLWKSNTVITVARGGGAGHSVSQIIEVTPGSKHNVVVGKGGEPCVSPGTATGTSENGKSGGSSAAFGLTATGGGGGLVTRTGASESAVLSSTAIPVITNLTGVNSAQLFGGKLAFDYKQYAGSNLSTFVGASDILSCLNPFECKRILGAGGYAMLDSATSGGTGPNGLGGGAGTYSRSNGARGKAATDNGCGGGGIVCGTDSLVSAPTCYSGAGGDGAVKIYVKGVVL